MRHHNRFAGHLDVGDPRTIISGAGGCTWPTIPPFRVQLSSTNATGEWLFLRHRPIILEQDMIASHHNYVLWYAIDQPREVYNVILQKYFIPSKFPQWDYSIRIQLNPWASPVVWFHHTSGKCNKDILWGTRYRTVQMGTTGNHFMQYQVEYNKFRYPGWHER